MRRTYNLLATVLFAGAMLAGCDNADNGTGSTNPPPPAVGKDQIDRMGRAGVNTALTNPFFRKTVAGEESQHEAVQDEYNGSAEPADWASMFTDEIAASLAVLDGLDQNCGNQIVTNGQPAGPNRYKALAGILADDELYVNTNSGSCQQYLAVEGNAIGITNSDCGGRTPLEDSIDTTYSVLAVGALTGVGDGIRPDGDGQASLTAFPFLDKPNT